MNYRHLDWLYYTNTLLVGTVLTLAFANQVSALPAVIQVLGRTHLMLLHFPIVLFFIAAIAETFARKNTSVLQRDIILSVFSLSTSIAALAGLMLSHEATDELNGTDRHKWLGLGMMASVYSWYIFRQAIRTKPWFNSLWIVACGILVTLVGHEGAALTHGSGFLTDPIRSNSTDKPVPTDPLVYQDLVVPILEKKCYQCHNPDKSKGDLDLSTKEGLQKGGKNGKLFDATPPGHSLLMNRLLLPLDSKEHMPPRAKPQLNEDELHLIRNWINAGMPFDVLYSKLKPNDSLALACGPFLRRGASSMPTFPELDPSVLTMVNTNYCSVSRLSNNSNALRASFYSNAAFTLEQLDQLLPVKAQLVELNLAQMPIEDKDLDKLKKFTALRKLNLSFTKIKGSTLDGLLGLEQLSELSLSGCSLSSSEIVQHLQKLKSLKSIFLWNTGLKDEQINALQKSLPFVKIITGYAGNDKVIQLPPPVITNEKTVFEREMTIQLKHVMKGAAIRYTTDGSEPDSVTSLLFPEKGLNVTKSTHLHARAFMPGWNGSTTVKKQFFKTSLKADSTTLHHPANPQYAARGSSSLQDSKTGTPNFRTPNWMGFREKPMHIHLAFKEKKLISEVILSSLNDIGSYIVPPALIRIKYKSESGKWVSCFELKPTFSNSTPKNELVAYECKLPSISCKELVVEVVPVPVLPNWHPGKGDRGWFFIDEIFIN